MADRTIEATHDAFISAAVVNHTSNTVTELRFDDLSMRKRSSASAALPPADCR
jgi:hypothetical protein